MQVWPVEKSEFEWVYSSLTQTTDLYFHDEWVGYYSDSSKYIEEHIQAKFFPPLPDVDPVVATLPSHEKARKWVLARFEEWRKDYTDLVEGTSHDG